MRIANDRETLEKNRKDLENALRKLSPNMHITHMSFTTTHKNKIVEPDETAKDLINRADRMRKEVCEIKEHINKKKISEEAYENAETLEILLEDLKESLEAVEVKPEMQKADKVLDEQRSVSENETIQDLLNRLEEMESEIGEIIRHIEFRQIDIVAYECAHDIYGAMEFVEEALEEAEE
jgi:hypothetical protein